MLGQRDNLDKNLKDIPKDSVKDSSMESSSLVPWHTNFSYYNKINKLITALYMVTDTMEKEEPIRLKLRTFGVDILSDINSLKKDNINNIDDKITVVLSFLNIVSDMGMVSKMNCNILIKEFMELRESIREFKIQDHTWLEEFMLRPSENKGLSLITKKDNSSPHTMSLNKGQSLPRHQTGSRIGVQKGSTLMNALNKVEGNTSFEAIKKQRRESITKIIKNRPSGISIKDIVLALQNLGEAWGEKTLQRELISMIKDNVLKKTGEKRWSLYMLVSNN